MSVNIRKTTHSISRYPYNALQIHVKKFVQVTSNSYAAELQKKKKKNFCFFLLRKVKF